MAIFELLQGKGVQPDQVEALKTDLVKYSKSITGTVSKANEFLHAADLMFRSLEAQNGGEVMSADDQLSLSFLARKQAFQAESILSRKRCTSQWTSRKWQKKQREWR